jgi:hypothetical protein
LLNTTIAKERALTQYAYKKAAGLDSGGSGDPERTDMTIFV